MSFIAPESLAEQIASHIAQRIIRGELRPKERLQESRVVNELDVSRGPVREAFLILESRHLVTILPRRGAIVTEMTLKSVNSLYDVYVTLLIMLANNVADVWTEDNMHILLDQAAKLQSFATDETQLAFMEAGFILMNKASVMVDNQYLSQLLEDLQPAIHRMLALALRYSTRELTEASQFFGGLVTAVLARDKQAIQRVLIDFGEHQRQVVCRALEMEDSSCA